MPTNLLKNKTTTLIIFLMVVFLLPKISQAATYYVDSRCPNNGNGLASSCAPGSGQAGAYNNLPATMSTDGNTYSLAKGSSYTITVSRGLGNNTTINTYGSASEDKPKLTWASNTNQNEGIFYIQNNNIAIDGLHLITTNLRGIYINPSYKEIHDILITNCDFDTSQKVLGGSFAVSAINYFDSGYGGYNFKMTDNTFTNGGSANNIFPNSAIQLYPVKQSYNWNISDNTFSNISGFGIQFIDLVKDMSTWPYGITIDRNNFTNVTESAVAIPGQRHVDGYADSVSYNTLKNIGSKTMPNVNALQLTINGMLVEGNDIDGVVTSVADGIGIILDFSSNPVNDSSGILVPNIVRYNKIKNAKSDQNNNGIYDGGGGIQAWQAKNNIIYNNIVIDSYMGYSVGTQNCSGNKFYNNIAYNNVYGISLFYTISPSVPNTFINNISWNNNIYSYSYDIDVSDTAPIAVHLIENHNIFKTARRLTPNSTDINSDPQFIDPANGNFHLKSTSPAIDKGINVGLTADYDGTPIPQGAAPDIGAYEYGSTLTCTPGDANSDGSVNISDVQTCINVILGADTTHQACSDMNTSNTVDITDCQAIINLILGT